MGLLLLDRYDFYFLMILKQTQHFCLYQIRFYRTENAAKHSGYCVNRHKCCILYSTRKWRQGAGTWMIKIEVAFGCLLWFLWIQISVEKVLRHADDASLSRLWWAPDSVHNLLTHRRLLERQHYHYHYFSYHAHHYYLAGIEVTSRLQ